MADERTDAMTSSAIEREIAQALAVEPSPEFLARVRMRVASEPPPRRAWATWMPLMVGATAIAAAVLIAVIAPWRRAPVRLTPVTTTSTNATAGKDVALAAAGSATPTAVGSGLSRTKTPQASQVSVGSAFSRTVAEPEVLVPQAEIDMYRRLIASARASSPAALVEAPPEIVASEIAADVQPPSELTIEPIKIDPITPQSSGEGVHP
jgi:hypothetical protein